MKSVMNSKRSPFHVYRNGHDDGLRSSSVIVIDRATAQCLLSTIRAGAVCGNSISAWTMPDGHSTRTASGSERLPSPNITSAGTAAGLAALVSSFCHRLPARTSTLAPTPLRLLTLPARFTLIVWFEFPASFRAILNPRGPPGSIRSWYPQPSKSPDAKDRIGPGGLGGPPAFSHPPPPHPTHQPAPVPREPH